MRVVGLQEAEGVGHSLRLAFVSCDAVLAFYWLVQFSNSIRVLSTDLLFLLISSVCSYFAIVSLRAWGVRDRFSVLYICVSLGIILTTIGNAIEFRNAINGGIPTFPSVEDFLDFAGGVLIILGLLQFLYSVRWRLPRTETIICIACALFGTGMVTIVALRSVSPPSGIGAVVVALSFPVVGILGLLGSLLMLFTFSDGEIAFSWLSIAAGAFCFSVGNTLYSLAVLAGWYYVGNPLEILWVWGYIALAVGFQAERKILKSGNSST